MEIKNLIDNVYQCWSRSQFDLTIAQVFVITLQKGGPVQRVIIAEDHLPCLILVMVRIHVAWARQGNINEFTEMKLRAIFKMENAGNVSTQGRPFVDLEIGQSNLFQFQ